jgi:ribonuclease VapC
LIVVDTSALFAILADEPEAPTFRAIIDAAERVVCSAVTFAELGVVWSGRFGQDLRPEVSEFIQALGVSVVSASESAALDAVSAYVAHGKGFGSAKLNFCDCFSYALVKEQEAPLLFKGDDFARTDILPAWRPAQP